MRWPWVALIVLGAMVVVSALVGASLVIAGELPRSTISTYAAMAAVGAVLLLIGLVGVAVRAIRVKRLLPAGRYRGPSIFVMLLIALVAGNLVSSIFLLDDLGALMNGDPLPALTGSILLLLTAATFIVVSWLFVFLPGALAGVRLADGSGTRMFGRIVAGLGMGVVAWVAVAVISLGVEWTARELGQPTEGQQMVADLLANVPPAVAITGAAAVVPLGEELFFRGVVLNAWEREYGVRRGLWGSALLFTAVHVPDGGFLIVIPILVLALLLGVAYQRTRSLALVVAMHGGFNLVSMLLLLYGPQPPI